MDIPPDMTEQYSLQKKAMNDGWVYVKIWKGMYGLPQVGLLAQEQLENHLARNGYWQSKHTPELWTHETQEKYIFTSSLTILVSNILDETTLNTSNKFLSNITKSQQIGGK